MTSVKVNAGDKTFGGYLSTTAVFDLNAIAEVAHDMRTPLTVISLSANMLEESSTLDEKERAVLLKQITDNSREIEGMLNAMINAARRTRTRRAGQEWVSLAEVVDATISEHSVLYRGRSIVVMADSEYRISAEKHQVRRIASNVLSNALKYSSPDSTVTIRMHGTPDEIVLSVEDQGIGISEQEQKLLFQPFFRSNDARYSVRGHGLGLCSVKHLIEEQGGRIRISSEAGKGTLVEVVWPRNFTSS